METLRRHRASAANVHFSVQKDKKGEGRVLAQLSYFFFSMKNTASSKMSPLFAFAPVFPVENHFCISSKWPPEVIELPCWLV